jgi:hypothetical protein
MTDRIRAINQLKIDVHKWSIITRNYLGKSKDFINSVIFVGNIFRIRLTLIQLLRLIYDKVSQLPSVVEKCRFFIFKL